MRFSFLFLPVFLAALTLTAADGDLDLSFGSSGKVTVDLGNGSTASAMKVQADGKIVTAGHVQTGGATGRDGCVMRFTADGALDGTFGNLGVVQTDFGSDGDWLNEVLVLEDGRILAAGFRGSLFMGGVAWAPVVARYLENGTLDGTFGTGGKLVVSALEGRFGASLLPLEGGAFLLGSWDGFVVKFSANGVQDLGYGMAGVAATGVTSARAKGCYALGAGGTVYVGGGRLSAGNTRSAIARLTALGSLDAGFGSGGVVEWGVSATYYDSLEVLAYDGSDGSVVALGSINGGNESAAFDVFLMRFSAAGVVDAGMGLQGVQAMEFGPEKSTPSDLKILPDGRLLVAASHAVGNDGSFVLARRLRTGGADATLNGIGYVTHSFGNWSEEPTAMAFQDGGKLVMAGETFLSKRSAALLRVEHAAGSRVGLEVRKGAVVVNPVPAPALMLGTKHPSSHLEPTWLTLRNTGDRSIVGLRAEVAEVPGGQFTTTQAEGETWTLLPGESRELGLLFGSVTSGSYQALLSLTSESLTGGSFDLLLRAVVTANGTPLISQPPASLLLLEDRQSPTPGTLGVLTVNARVNEALILTYQWYRDEVLIPNATGATLALTRNSGPGSYRVLVRTSKGTAYSDPALVGLLHPGLPSPVNVYRSETAVLDLNPELRLPAGSSLGYAWSGPGGALGDGGRFAGVNTSRLEITGTVAGDDGVYSCLCSLLDADGQVLAEAAVPFDLSVMGAPTLSFSGQGLQTRVWQDVNVWHADLGVGIGNAPTSYTVTGLPPGVLFNGGTTTSLFFYGRPRLSSALPQTAMVTIRATNPAGSAEITVPWVLLPGAEAGEYRGLVRVASLDMADQRSLAGRLQFMVTANGGVSGTVTQRGIVRRFVGNLDSGVLERKFLLPAQQGLLASWMEMTFSDDDHSGSGLFHDGSDELVVPPLQVTFDRAGYKGWTTAKQKALTGRYNAIVYAENLGLEPSVPLGYGVLSLTVSSTGMVTWLGRLPDATALTGSSPVLGRESPTVFLHQSLYGNTGVFYNQVVWPPTESPSLWQGVSIMDYGGWVKLPRAKNVADTSYREGFLQRSGLDGSRYTPPGKGQTFMNLLPVPKGQHNAVMDVTLEDAPRPLSESLRFTGPSSMDAVTGTPRVRLYPVGATGLVLGDILFKHEDSVNPNVMHTRSGIFNGIFSQGLGVAGYVGMPALPVKGRPARWLSGRVQIIDSRFK
jgi:uncharacterized delta-60 repeat protein